MKTPFAGAYEILFFLVIEFNLDVLPCFLFKNALNSENI